MPGISLSSDHQSWFQTKLLHLFWRVIGILPDRPYVRLKYLSLAGRLPNLDAPRLFSEKVQLRKLYDRNPLYPQMVDKHGAKALIAERAGPQYVVPTYWAGTDLSTIDWTTIPLPAVAKPTHASGFGAFLHNQSDIDALVAANPASRWLAVRYHRFNREWAYGQFKPLVIIEEMLIENGDAPDDFRFFVFDGRISHIEIRLRRNGKGYECNYTEDWQRMEFDTGYYESYHEPFPRPEQLPEMIEVVKKIAADSDFMRVDLYVRGQDIFVGELTLYPGGGFQGCVADEYDEMLGGMWQQRLARA